VSDPPGLMLESIAPREREIKYRSGNDYGRDFN
jgi:hypothetical protein